jgi:CheY-like chemotaxis protein
MINVLYVEDDAVFRGLVCDIFKYNNDFTIVCAKSGQEGIDMALEKDYDIIIMDIMMPDIDGWKATRKIREVKPNSVIIALSALSVKDLDGNSIFDEHVRKPIRGYEFKNTLKEVAIKKGIWTKEI